MPCSLRFTVCCCLVSLSLALKHMSASVHHKVVSYFMTRFQCTLVVPSNLIVRCAVEAPRSAIWPSNPVMKSLAAYLSPSLRCISSHMQLVVVRSYVEVSPMLTRQFLTSSICAVPSRG